MFMFIVHGIGCLSFVGRPIGITTRTDLRIVLAMLLETVRVAASERPVAATAG